MRKTALAFTLLLAAACATNPVTHKREFNIVSESQEIQIGEQSHPEVVKQYGIYDEKPELNRLVDTVGHRLAAVSDRPNLPWHFTIIDTPTVNAMALPGGYVYITRGMMERLNSEDELAGVLGHEITHVTARHAAEQMSRAQVAQLGMVLGSVVAGPAATQAVGQFAELGLNLLFQRYSRGQESQADLVGTEYVARAGWNPIGAERMLVTLERLDKHPTTGIDKYFESHPDPAKRVRDVEAKLKELAPKYPAALSKEPQRAPYVRMVDGIMTGNSTERVVVKGDTVYDRAHGLIMRAPAGWRPTAAEGMLFAMTPRSQNGRSQSNSVFLVQEVEDQALQGANVQDAVRGKLQQMGLQYAGSRQTAAATGQNFTVDVWSGQTDSGPIGVETTQFPHADHVAVLMFLSPNITQNQSPLGDVIRQAVIDPGRARAAQPPRIRVEAARAGETWADLARRATGNPADAEEVANINGYDVRTLPQAGTLIKLPSEVVKE